MNAFTTELRDGIAWLSLDVPFEPVNTIARAVREEFRAVLDWVRDETAARAAVLISAKTDNFIAGADIDEFTALRTRAEALALVLDGQELSERIAKLGKPVVAAIHGACLGGGLEAALGCTYRIATDHPKTSLGLPEVQLGIIPAAGGCQRLPRLIGVRGALDIILAGKVLPAKQAHKRGLVHELVHPAILRTVAQDAARRLADGWRPGRSRGGIADFAFDKNRLGRRLVFSRARKSVLSKTAGNYPAPLAAIEAVDHGLRYGVTHGLQNEAAHFAELAVGEVSRNLVQIFFAQRALKKDPGVEGDVPEVRPVENVAIVGAGFMGAAIAGVAVSQAGADARIKDVDAGRVATGLATARGVLADRLRRRRISRHEHRRLASLLSGGADWAGFRRVDLVVEAVFEELELKRRVFAELESQAKPECVLASNTSTIPISRISEGLQRPERVLGMHFFSPVEKMPLLEVVVAERTAAWATVKAVAFGRAMGKTCIVVRDQPGFWVNRILAPYLNEAGKLLQEGVGIDTVDATMKEFGFPVGPFALLDEVGLDVAVKASAVLRDAYGSRMEPVDCAARIAAAGRLGRKSGRGFYRYDRGKKRRVDAEAYELAGAAASSTLPLEQVRQRLVYAMLNEAARAVEEGVVRSARDGDIGAVFGIGFPPFRGGPLRYIDQIGPAAAVAILDELADMFGDRFVPAPGLVRLAERNERYHNQP